MSPLTARPSTSHRTRSGTTGPRGSSKNYLPRKYGVSYILLYSTQIPAYNQFIQERFDRCLDLYLAPRVRGGLKGRRVCCELWEGADARVDREVLEEVDSERPSEFELANSWRAENEEDEESDIWRRRMGAGGDARSLSSSIWNDS